MNLFESTLSAALHDEASEFAMSTDLNEGREILHNRLDVVDRGRHRWQIVGGLVAAAAAVGVIAFLAVGRPTATPPADPNPTPSPTAASSSHYSSSQFALPFAMDLPAWTSTPGTDRNDTAAYVIWVNCRDGGDCVGLTVTRYTNLPDKGGSAGAPIESYTSYLAYLDALANRGSIAVTGTSQTTVDGRPATSFTIETSGAAGKGAMGCPSDGECDDFLGSGHYVVVDLGAGAPLSIWSRTANRPDWVAQMDDVLPTFRLLQGAPGRRP